MKSPYDKKFGNYLKTLSCNGCKFFKEICTHENGIENEKDKFQIREDYLHGEYKDKVEYDKWMKNENDWYVCTKYKVNN